MGHLVEAFKKLDQKRAAERPKPTRRTDVVQRAAIRPKPVRRTPAAKYAQKAWRIDEPHSIAAAHHVSEPPDAEKLDVPATPPQTEDVQSEVGFQKPPQTVLEATIAAPPESHSAARLDRKSAGESGWQFPAPAIPGSYFNLAECLTAQQKPGAAFPHSILLTAVADFALDAVSVGALAAILSSQGTVLWIDTRNVRPTLAATIPARVKNPGWHALRTGQATWEEVTAPTSLTGVSFVGCGDQVFDGTGSEFDGRLFEPLGSSISFVLIDGGSIEKSAALASACSVTGLVVAVGQTRRSQVDRALRMLEVAGTTRPLMIAVESPSRT